MEIGDKVAHRKHGRGVIEGFKNLSTRGKFASVQFDNLSAAKYIREDRLRIIPDVGPVDDSRPREPLPPKKRDKSIDYALLEQAERTLKEQHPEADLVRAFPYQHHAVVEIWKDGRASVVRYERRTSAT